MKRLIDSIRFAVNGFVLTFKTEQNFRIHLMIMCYVIGFMGYFNLSRGEKALVILLFGAVLSAEMVNTAIEYIINMKVEGYDIHAKYAKDIAAGAVLVFAAVAIGVAMLLFFDIEVFKNIGYDLICHKIKLIAFIASLIVSYIICFVVRYRKK